MTETTYEEQAFPALRAVMNRLGWWRAHLLQKPEIAGTWLDRPPTPSQLRGRFLRDEVARLAEHGGVTSHSQMGDTLQMILRGLEHLGVPYTLSAHPHLGYSVTVTKKEDR